MSSRHDPDSRIGRLRAFFDRNPHEELTYSDIAIKFRCTTKQANHVVCMLKRLGYLATDTTRAPVVHRRAGT